MLSRNCHIKNVPFVDISTEVLREVYYNASMSSRIRRWIPAGRYEYDP